MGRRQATTSETRTRILAAARELLAASGAAGFSIEAVAQQADVARMTVYYQFGSKPGLLEMILQRKKAEPTPGGHSVLAS